MIIFVVLVIAGQPDLMVSAGQPAFQRIWLRGRVLPALHCSDVLSGAATTCLQTRLTFVRDSVTS